MSADRTTPRTRLLGGATLVAPVLLLASSLAYLAGEGTGVGQAGGVIQFWAFVAFALAVVGLTGALEIRAPRAATALLALGMAGALAGAGFGIDAVRADLAGGARLIDAQTVASILVTNLPGVVFPLVLIGLGVLLGRGGAQPRWAAVALGIGGALFPLSRIGSIEGLAVVGDVVLLAALVPLGLRLMRGDALVGPVSARRAPAAHRAATV